MLQVGRGEGREVRVLCLTGLTKGQWFDPGIVISKGRGCWIGLVGDLGQRNGSVES